MTDHDSCCPSARVGHMTNTACWCPEIAQVRADERGRILGAVEALRSHIRRRNTQVWSNVYRSSYWTAVRIPTVDRDAVLAAINDATNNEGNA